MKTVDGLHLIEDEEYMDYQMRQLGAREGTDVPHNFYARLIADLETERAFKHDYEADPAGVSGGVPLSEEQLDAEARVISIMHGVMQGLDQTEMIVPHEFEERAKQIASETLDSNEKEERAEAFRYGIDWKTVSVQVADCLFGDCTREQTEYMMGGESPAVTELQAKANILLPRRQELYRAKQELDEARQEMGGCDYGCEGYADAEDKAERDFKEKGDAYALLLGYFGETYPILAALGDPDRDPDDLEDLTKQKAGPGMAELLGKEIVKRLANIKDVREGLSDPDSVNIWRLPILVGLTKAQMGIDNDPFEKRVIDERVESEKPGILESLALLVFNIGALLLAAPTGGASLVVAAGVNAAVAVEHVKEYLMQSALAGTAFDKAKGLSRDEPSLFWLAVEVVGVAVDSFAAFNAVSEAVKVVEAAKEAGDAAKEARVLEELEAVARKEGGEELVGKVVAHFGEHPTEESEVLKALGIGEEEAKALRSGEQLAKEELDAGAASGKAAAAGGPVKVSRLGHVFSCSSPCTWMREKYAALLGPDVILEGETTSLRQQYLAFEERAMKAAEDVRLAKEPGELAKAEEAAAQLEKEIAEFDRKLSRELRARDPERLARVKLIASLQDSNPLFKKLGPGALERVVDKAPRVDQMKGQLFEELLGSRMAERAAREAAAGSKAVKAAAAAKSEIEFIPGHLIKDAEGQLFTDGILAYREGDRWHVVAIFEGKAGRASAQKLKRAWKDFPHPENVAEAASWRSMSAADLKKLAKSTDTAGRGLASRIRRWKEVRMEAIEELRGSDATLEGLHSSVLEAKYKDQIDALMETLPKSESGQALKSIERLLPNEGDTATGIKIGKPQPDGSVAFDEGSLERVTGSRKTTELIGVVPSDVKGRNLQKIAEQEKIKFQLMNDLGVKESDLQSAAESLAAAAKAGP